MIYHLFVIKILHLYTNVRTDIIAAKAIVLKPKVYGAIFDMDGTLLDTEEVSRLSIDMNVHRLNKEFIRAMHKIILGRPAVERTRTAITTTGLSEEIITS